MLKYWRTRRKTLIALIFILGCLRFYFYCRIEKKEVLNHQSTNLINRKNNELDSNFTKLLKYYKESCENSISKLARKFFCPCLSGKLSKFSNFSINFFYFILFSW